jgi:O-antigen ligase
MQSRLLTLPKRQQILLGAGVVILLAGLFLLTGGSLIPLGILLVAAVGYAVIRNPVWSIFAFVVIDVVLTLRPKETLAGDAPTTLDLLLGIVLVGMVSYWIIKLRFYEFQSLSTSVGQLCLSLFFVWSLFVTALGFIFGQIPLFTPVRELLNLSPLLILPLLYELYITPDSKTERLLFAAVVVAGIIIIVRGIVTVRSSILDVAYLWQVGRTHLDETLPGFLALVATSVLMSIRRLRTVLVSGGLFLFASIGIIVTFSRGLYVSTLVSLAVVLLLGSINEFRKGSKRLLLTGTVAIVGMIPVYFSNRLIRLVLIRYGLRFLSTPGSLKSDLSLLNRYAEYRDVWQAIQHSALFGYGFGARFRTFQIIDHTHHWATFTHNSYLHMAFKTGIPGFLLFFLAYFVFLYKGFMLTRSDKLSPITLIITRASVAYLVLILIYALTAPIVNSKTDMVWIGLIWGYFLALEQKIRRENDTTLIAKRIIETTMDKR